ncbi:MAG: hypothetical protein KKC11_00405 [Candidatus Omnitrophica bacterium]|nr:hypothetical protein [Candidatus Omnitrophota bacterium]MBU0879138.1 hypothetical protein [Candidatus Omnitrophota bacterium]MBU1133426.1 hypothetical protein [Candidatus Omnitrophota bacterium]MBU1523673.1 hypothetical protein [Candidatus Omnitrophota bacterium]
MGIFFSSKGELENFSFCSEGASFLNSALVGKTISASILSALLRAGELEIFLSSPPSSSPLSIKLRSKPSIPVMGILRCLS